MTTKMGRLTTITGPQAGAICGLQEGEKLLST